MTSSRRRITQSVYLKNLELQLGTSKWLVLGNEEKRCFTLGLARYLARLYLSESLLAINQVDAALNQLDADTIKNDSDLSFRMAVTTVEKGE